jgi:hypothetical protein
VTGAWQASFGLGNVRRVGARLSLAEFRNHAGPRGAQARVGAVHGQALAVACEAIGAAHGVPGRRDVVQRHFPNLAVGDGGDALRWNAAIDHDVVLAARVVIDDL